MMLRKTPNARQEFRRIPWKFQQTFKTPPKNLRPFVTALVAMGQRFETFARIIFWTELTKSEVQDRHTEQTFVLWNFALSP
jgi:hypothetical protein